MSEVKDKNTPKDTKTPNKPPKRNKKSGQSGISWMYLLIFAMFGMMWFSNRDNGNNKDIDWSEFQQLAQDNKFSEMTVHLNAHKVVAQIKPAFIKEILKVDSISNPYPFLGETKPTVTVVIPSSDRFSDFYDKTIAQYNIDSTVKYAEGSVFWDIVVSCLPFILLIGFWIFMMRGAGGGSGMGGIFNVGKTRAQMYDKSSPNAKKVTFKDVAGLSEAKQEVEEIVDFLKNPNKYTNLGAKIPKGALLVGPPGTGKTLLAKAVAGEAEVPFFSLSGSDFVEMFVGVGASRVRDLFRQAKDKAPCIVFIDEIDAVGRARNRNLSMGGNDERESTLNQLLTEMDGFGTNSGVILLAATNRADVLDKALLRAGRFDRQIDVDLPELNDRKEIFVVHLRNIKIDNTVDTEFLARQTPGFSGADIANVCNEAALIAARTGKEFVQKEDFMNAVDRIVGGLEKKSVITTVEERRSIALHEAGHATLSWMLEYANPLVKVTIVPRGKALGAAWYMPEERQIVTYNQMQDEMCATLGGRAAEDLFLGRIGTGASNDLEKVTKQAYAMVVYYGMSERLPNLNYYDATGQDWGFNKPYSDHTAQLIDEEIKRIISEQYTRAKEILTQYKDKHHALTEVLLSKEVIFSDDLESIFGKRQWVSRSQEILDQHTINNPDEAAKELLDQPEQAIGATLADDPNDKKDSQA
jgi:cell division protease FtsH